jgi:hypothetical protein
VVEDHGAAPLVERVGEAAGRAEPAAPFVRPFFHKLINKDRNSDKKKKKTQMMNKSPTTTTTTVAAGK